MSKVIVERSRRGGKYSRDKKWTGDIEDAPRREGMRARHSDRKSLNENLSPLKKFLNKQVGRHWDQVFSEICANIKLSNTVQRHVREHIKDFVEADVYSENGKVFYNKNLRYATNRELSYQQLYICPKTGVLKKYNKNRIKKTKYQEKTPLEKDLSMLSWSCPIEIDLNDPFEIIRVHQDLMTNSKLKEKSTQIHAKLDFASSRFNSFEGVKKFFSKYPKIEKENSYWKEYYRLYKEHLKEEEFRKNQKNEANPETEPSSK